MNRANWQMKAILMVFTKNFLLGANDSFWPQRWHMPITSKNFFEILHNERSYQVHRNYVNGFFPKKNPVWGKWTIQDPKCPHNSGSIVRIVLKFCTMKGAKRGMGILLMVFLKKILFWAILLCWPKNDTALSFSLFYTKMGPRGTWQCYQLFS